MPAAGPNQKSLEICAVCKDSAPLRGLFRSLDPSVPAPICFACVFVHTLKGCTCQKCGNAPCIGFVVFEVEPNGRIAPAPICPDCILDYEGDEIEVIIDKNRSVIREVTA